MSVFSVVAVLAGTSAWAQTAPPLGQAGSFAVLGGSDVNNTGSSRLFGDLGVSPGSVISGFPPGIVSGATHTTDAVAAQAQLDVTAAYTQLAGQVATTDMSGTDLGGLTLVAGVYRYTSSALLTGTLTLNAQGNANAVFIFQVGSTLTAASGSRVQVINGGSPCNVFWQVGSSATLNTTSAFAGNILALTSITLRTGATVTGRVLVRNGAATLDANDVTSCAATCGAIALSPGTLADGTAGTAYSSSISASGGTAPFSYAVTSGTLPAGLVLTSAGTLAGTPTLAGTSTFTVTASDAAACTGSQSYNLLINPSGGSTGDPHMRSLDGLAFEFQACGDFVLLRTSSAALEVQVRQERWIDSNYSVNTEVAMKVGGHTVQLAPLGKECDLGGAAADGCVRVDGRPVTFECELADQAPGCLRSFLLPGVGRVEQRVRGISGDRKTKALTAVCNPALGGACLPLEAPCNKSYTLQLFTGEQVKTCVGPGYLNVGVEVPGAERGRTSGLLGNADGDPSNDLQVGEAENLPLVVSFEDFNRRFGDRWRLAPGQSLFETPSLMVQCTPSQSRLSDLPAATRDHALATCQALGIDPGTLDECAMDVAVMGDSAAASFIGIGAPRAVVTLTDGPASAVGCGGCGSTDGGPMVFALALVGLAVLGSRRRVVPQSK